MPPPAAPPPPDTKRRFAFRAPPTLGLPITLTRKRIYILPTRPGAVFAAVLLGMLVGSINYNNNLGFLLTFSLGGLAFVSIFHTFRNLLNLNLLSSTAKPLFAGESGALELTVDSGDSERYAIEFNLQGERPVSKHFPAGAPLAVAVPFTAGARGHRRFAALTVATRYPLGLVRAWAVFRPDLDFWVYPRPIHAPLRFTLAGDPSQSEGQETIPRGAEDFQGLKPYQPGDSLRHIFWKALSKGQGVLTKEFVSTSGGAVSLDWDLFSDTDTEQRLSLLCGMVIHAEKTQLSYGLRLPGRSLSPDNGPAHLHACLRALAVFGQPAESDNPRPAGNRALRND